MLYLQVRNSQNMSETARNLKKFKSEARVSTETFPGGATRYFAYPFHAADYAIQMRVHKTLCPFYTITKMPPATQGRNEWVQRGHNSPGAESLWEHQVTAGAP